MQTFLTKPFVVPPGSSALRARVRAVIAAHWGGTARAAVARRADCRQVNAPAFSRARTRRSRRQSFQDLGNSFEQVIPQPVQQVLDLDLASDDPPAVLTGQLLKVSPSFSLRGGTWEIVRGSVARGPGQRTALEPGSGRENMPRAQTAIGQPWSRGPTLPSDAPPSSFSSH